MDHITSKARDESCLILADFQIGPNALLSLQLQLAEDLSYMVEALKAPRTYSLSLTLTLAHHPTKASPPYIRKELARANCQQLHVNSRKATDHTDISTRGSDPAIPRLPNRPDVILPTRQKKTLELPCQEIRIRRIGSPSEPPARDHTHALM